MPTALRALILVLLFLLPARALAEQATAEDRRAELKAAIASVSVQDTGKAFLWKVTSKRKKHRGTAWLFGSVHLGLPEMYPLNAAIDRAFEGSDALVVEADVAAPGVEKELAAKMLELARMDEGTTLESLVPERAEELKDALARYMVPMVVANTMKPFMISMMLSLLELQWAGWDPAYGIDRRFLDQARGHKEIIELESVEMQLQIFADLGVDVQVAMLEASLDFHGLADQWTRLAWSAIAAGDTEALVTLADIEGGGAADPALDEFNTALLDDRNVGMAKLVVDHVTKGEGTWFVVVGALHLPGEDGLLDLLDDKRFLKIEQQGRQ